MGTIAVSPSSGLNIAGDGGDWSGDRERMEEEERRGRAATAICSKGADVLEAVERHHQGERRRRSNQKHEGEGGAGNGGAGGRRRGGERRHRWEQEAR
ncbi:hypothetical protein U1Q18_017655 [Sarracenia purpurea var. burkii]